MTRGIWPRMMPIFDIEGIGMGRSEFYLQLSLSEAPATPRVMFSTGS